MLWRSIAALLCRALSRPITAKIAHGYAIAHFGFEFQPLLLDIIEGNIAESGRFIGMSYKKFDVPANANRHIMGHEARVHGKTTLIYVFVGLFAGLGAPVHMAIAGAFDTDKPPTTPSWLNKDKPSPDQDFGSAYEQGLRR